MQNTKAARKIVTNFDPGNHSPKARSRARAAAVALAHFVDDTGKISDERLSAAVQSARSATGNYWCTARCRCLASQMRLITTEERA